MNRVGIRDCNDTNRLATQPADRRITSAIRAKGAKMAPARAPVFAGPKP
jgi:hypothetical protein